MATVEQIAAQVRRKQSEQARQRLARWAEVCSLWEQCYEAEGLNAATPVVAFSQDNPYLAKYAEAIATYMGCDALTLAMAWQPQPVRSGPRH